ncbi:hypothetical protein FACS189425_09270 [Clostridia bacterium]|nr:hypothetical protein FACS189425_09270 [Clostridia bacterium]
MSFKEQLEEDLREVFHNADEFAEVKRIKYLDNDWEIPVVIDTDIIKSRPTPSDDHSQGIYLADIRVFINAADLDGVVPRKGKNITIGVRKYKIVRVDTEMGEFILDLEMNNE